MLRNLAKLLNDPAEVVAPRLLGCYLARTINGRQLVGKIVETEAYHETDAASHSYKGRTARTEVMFGPPGHMYVYFTYGMHYCCNVVCGNVDEGTGVLIRAVEPVEGEEIMALNRGHKNGVEITNGPAKVCQALQIDKRFNGHDLRTSPIELIVNKPIPQTEVVQTTRIGISVAKEMPWRFYIKDNPYVSKL